MQRDHRGIHWPFRRNETKRKRYTVWSVVDDPRQCYEVYSMHKKLKKFKSCCCRRRFYYIAAYLCTSFAEFLLDCLRTYVPSVRLLTTYRSAFLGSFKILVTSLNLYPFSTRNSYTRGLQAFDIFRETFLCIEMILTEMCHRSSSALRTRFHRGNDILKVYHYQVNHYTRKKESDERKRIQRHDFSGSSRKSSMVSFSFHSFTLVFIRVHPSNERTIPILAFRVHRVPSSAYIRFTSKKIHSFGEKENEMME